MQQTTVFCVRTKWKLHSCFYLKKQKSKIRLKYTADRKYYFVTFPKGLFGVLKMIAFVFGLKAASNSLGSIFQPLAERQLSSDYEMSD
jgi:hypothetical protein